MKVFFVGGASLARLCRNILKKNGHEVPIIYDRTKGLRPPWDCFLFDDESAIPKYAKACQGFLVCIGDVHGEARVRYSRQLYALGLEPISAIHPAAHIGDDVILGKGLQAMPGAIINDFAMIGDFCLVNSNCSIGHECVLNEGVHVMSGATIAGLVKVGAYSSIGTGATILPRIAIGANCIVGAGAVVTNNIPNSAVVAGVPAKILRYRASADVGTSDIAI